MAKRSSTIFEIFLQGIGLYFSNIDRFIWYMLFPVFGQLLGILFTFFTLYFYNEYKMVILSNIPALKTPLYLNIALCVILLPGIIIWGKALWEYMVSYSAINSMTENMLKSERVYDFPAHTMMVTRRWGKYIGLWILYSGLILMSCTVIFTGFAWILMIYYAFIFQIFMFEPELSPSECFKKSSSYIQNNLKQTLLMITLVGGLTYVILPQIILTFIDTVKGLTPLKDFIQTYISVPSLDWINMVLSAMGASQIMPSQVALFIAKALILIIIVELLLPLRVICMCLWYKNFHNDAGSMKMIDDRILERAGAGKNKKK